jgi:hypothetical protein
MNLNKEIKVQNAVEVYENMMEQAHLLDAKIDFLTRKRKRLAADIKSFYDERIYSYYDSITRYYDDIQYKDFDDDNDAN